MLMKSICSRAFRLGFYLPATLAVACCAFGLLFSQAGGQMPRGTVERIQVHGTALEGNLEGDSPDRFVSIYLPPSYAKERSRRYPVIYLLRQLVSAIRRNAFAASA